MEDLAGKLTSWIGDQVAASGCRGAVFGLSGGIDSAVAGVLCRRALPESTLALVMPCYSSREDLDDARLVADKFSIPTVTVNLDGVHDAFLDAVPESECEPGTESVAGANLKPRLRMVTLYYFANRLRYLVVGTSNRSEIAVGYSTKYGDSAADILPLGNLLKRQVRELAAHLGIPARIVEKAPSAGLWEGQTDEGELGLTYEELDRYLRSGEASEDVRRRIDSLARAGAHKRATPPIPPF